MMWRWGIVGCAFVGLISCTPKNEKQVRDATPIAFTLQRTLPHDPKAFTQFNNLTYKPLLDKLNDMSYALLSVFTFIPSQLRKFTNQ